MLLNNFKLEPSTKVKSTNKLNHITLNNVVKKYPKLTYSLTNPYDFSSYGTNYISSYKEGSPTYLPYTQHNFFLPRVQLYTPYLTASTSVTYLVDYLRTQGFFNTSRLYRFMSTNPTYLVGSFYRYYNNDNLTAFVTKSPNTKRLNKPEEGEAVKSSLNPDEVTTSSGSCRVVKWHLLSCNYNISTPTLRYNKVKTTHSSAWVRKLWWYAYFGRQAFKFKPQASYYNTRRYQFRSYRSYNGARWSFLNLSKHQAFNNNLHLDNRTAVSPKRQTGLISDSNGLFNLNLFIHSDLITESFFSAKINFSTTKSLSPNLNWRASSGYRKYLIGLLQTILISIKGKSSLYRSTKKGQLSEDFHNTLASEPSRSAASKYLINLTHRMVHTTRMYRPDTPQSLNTSYNFLPLTGLVKEPHTKNGLRLLQTNPLIVKNAFQYRFLLKYNLTKKGISAAAFSKHSFLTTDYLFTNKHLKDRRYDNLTPAPWFSYEIRRRLHKSFASAKFTLRIMPWYLTNLVRFIEHCSGRKVSVRLDPFLVNSLTPFEHAKCLTWTSRIGAFQKVLGHRFFLGEMIKAMVIALKTKDAVFLSNWIRGMLKRLSFWKMRVFFRFFKFMMRYVFWSSFDYFQFRGMKICLKGKISVAGNARTRTLVYRIGSTSYSTLDHKVAYDFSCIGSFTGVMGFRVWLFY